VAGPPAARSAARRWAAGDWAGAASPPASAAAVAARSSAAAASPSARPVRKPSARASASICAACARAAATISDARSAGDDAAGISSPRVSSCSKTKTSLIGRPSVDRSYDHLVLGGCTAAGDEDRARLLEPANDRDDLRLRLLDDAPRLRLHQVHLLGQNLGGALRHVGEHALLHVVRDAAQGERQILRVGLLEHGLDRAVVELEQILEDEQAR